MNLVVTAEQRFERTEDGNIWTRSPFRYSFWKRYTVVFDQVYVVARINNVKEVPQGSVRADGVNVSFVSIPYYIGPLGYLINYKGIAATIGSLIANKPYAYIFRVPSILALLFYKRLLRIGYPYALEVVGDPFDVYAYKALQHPFSIFFRYFFVRTLKEQCQNASAVSYVTEKTLQKIYPCGESVFSTFYSSIELNEKWFKDIPARDFTNKSEHTLVITASLEHAQKGVDLLLKAAHICLNEGIRIKVRIIGDGRNRKRFEDMSNAMRLSNSVVFLGTFCSGEDIIGELDKADLFVLPSRQEGVPRSIIEAMARGMPCISTRIGGIPELLHEEDLVVPNDVSEIVKKIKEVLQSPIRMKQMSARNLLKAAAFKDEILQKKREEFYMRVKKITDNYEQKKY